MYEVYYYTAKEYAPACYNIRNTTDNTTTGCCLTINKALSAYYVMQDDLLSIDEFEQTYNCKLLFITPTLTDLIDNYPEYFI